MTPAEVIARAVDPGAWGDCDDNPTSRHARAKHQQDARKHAARILAALRAAGFAVVPREATDAMVDAAIDRSAAYDGATIYHGVYHAMIAAAELRTGGE